MQDATNDIVVNVAAPAFQTTGVGEKSSSFLGRGVYLLLCFVLLIFDGAYSDKELKKAFDEALCVREGVSKEEALNFLHAKIALLCFSFVFTVLAVCFENNAFTGVGMLFESIAVYLQAALSQLVVEYLGPAPDDLDSDGKYRNATVVVVVGSIFAVVMSVMDALKFYKISLLLPEDSCLRWFYTGCVFFFFMLMLVAGIIWSFIAFIFVLTKDYYACPSPPMGG